MPDVTLVLKANNSDQISKMKESQKETQKVYDIAEKGSTKQKGLIEREIQMQKQLGESRNKATNVDNLKIYNGLLDDSKKRLTDLEQAGIKTEKQTTSLTQSIGKWVLGLGIAVTVLNKLQEAFLKTQQGMILFSQAGAAMNQVFSNIVNGVADWNTVVAQAMVLAKQMALLKIQEKRDSIETNKLLRDYNDLYQKGMDQTIKGTEKLKILTEAKGKFIEAIVKCRSFRTPAPKMIGVDIRKEIEQPLP